MVPASGQKGFEGEETALWVPGTRRRVIRAEGAEEASPDPKRRMFKAGWGPGEKRPGTSPTFEERAEAQLGLRQGQDQRGERLGWAWVQRRRLQTRSSGGTQPPAKV